MSIKEILIKSSNVEKEIKKQVAAAEIKHLNGDEFFSNLFIGYQKGSYESSINAQKLLSSIEIEAGTPISENQLKLYDRYTKVFEDANEKIEEIIADFVNDNYDSMKLPK